jgi:decaprenylphospho-beta-D-ribofuranose 2-oxidase
MDARQRLPLTGWGRTNATVADEVTVPTAHVAGLLDDPPSRGIIARGLGRSYGDAAQNAGGTVLRLRPDPAAITLDPVAGTATVDAGADLDAVIRHLVPRGWFVPVTPGTRFVTVGGAIASDIHGKNHHGEGSFGSHVLSLRLLLADGSVRALGPDESPELFWATVGGMGLTGVILEATFRLLPITSNRMVVDTIRTVDLDDVLARMADSDRHFRYSVAWVDSLATGRRLGRSVLTMGDHATAEQAGVGLDGYDPAVRVAAPPFVPGGLLNPLSIRAFNELWYRRAPRHRTGELQSIPAYFHPLDMIGHWNRLYGPRGFVQYQFIVPFGAEDTLRAVIERTATHGAGSFLTVLKRFGPANPAPLSFPRPGWTLTLDIPAAHRGLGRLLHELDEMVLAAGGRHYLAKDAHLSRAAFEQGYPRLDEWKQVRDKADPNGVWASDLARRLGLV